MKEMKTLTVNGETYTVADPDAAHIDDGKVSADVWSSKNTVDKLCPSFAKRGAVVTCEPVEGYSLEVVSHIEPIQEGGGNPSPDNIRSINGYAGCQLRRCGDIFTADFGQTVYGGSFNWSTGELVIDRKMITLDGSEYWLEQSTNTADKNRYGLRWANNQQLLEGAYACLKSNVKDDRLLCSKMKTGTADDTYMCREGISTYFTANQTYIYIYLEQYATDFEGFKKMMRGAQIVFGLEEPVTIQLTPREILALSGTNTISSDTGDTEVAGRVDIRHILENYMAKENANV